MSVEICRRLFTVDDYYRMLAAGILCTEDRVELIEGEVVTMSPIGSRHSACVGRANHALVTALGRAAIVRVQDPVRLNDLTEPAPDIAVVRPKPDFYASGHPAPADILLVIEVADSSLDYDRDVKVRIFGTAGVPEYWVVDVAAGIVFRYADPSHGIYRSISECRRGERIAPERLPGVSIAVEELVGD